MHTARDHALTEILNQLEDLHRRHPGSRRSELALYRSEIDSLLRRYGRPQFDPEPQLYIEFDEEAGDLD